MEPVYLAQVRELAERLKSLRSSAEGPDDMEEYDKLAQLITNDIEKLRPFYSSKIAERGAMIKEKREARIKANICCLC